MDSCFNLERAIKKAKDRGYPSLYWSIDLHDTIIEGKYSKFNEGREFYPDAKEVLQFLSKSPKHKLILWSSSHKEPIADILKWLESHGIKFDYVNSNPDFKNTDLNDFEVKFAFDILLDDKAGFVGRTDWTIIKRKLIELNEWYPFVEMFKTRDGTIRTSLSTRHFKLKDGRIIEKDWSSLNVPPRSWKLEDCEVLMWSFA